MLSARKRRMKSLGLQACGRYRVLCYAFHTDKPCLQRGGEP